MINHLTDLNLLIVETQILKLRYIYDFCDVDIAKTGP